VDDLVAFLEERNLPLDEIGRQLLAEQILARPPQQGYLTVSNALQWRLQYRRVLTLAQQGDTQGIENLVQG
ncbi:MAG: restriction endonuclease, partial [Chloroflexi bacterium]